MGGEGGFVGYPGAGTGAAIFPSSSICRGETPSPLLPLKVPFLLGLLIASHGRTLHSAQGSKQTRIWTRKARGGTDFQNHSASLWISSVLQGVHCKEWASPPLDSPLSQQDTPTFHSGHADFSPRHVHFPTPPRIGIGTVCCCLLGVYFLGEHLGVPG